MNVAPFELPRAIRFDNLRKVRSAGESYLDQHTDGAEFDLSTLEECNSAAVALLMAWVRYAHVLGKSVIFAGAPGDLLNIIEVAGLSGMLPMRK